MSFWDSVSQQISHATGHPFSATQQRSIGGGCINDAYRISDGKYHYFVKLNSAKLSDMFAAEAEGLNEIQASHSIHAPEVICYGVAGDQSYLVLNHIEFGSRGDQVQLGHDLAAMHRYTQSQFGWHRNNTIGATPQSNRQHHDWLSFWREERLLPQLHMAAAKGFGGRLQQHGERLAGELNKLLDGHQPAASLLHGDLWSGNYGFDSTGRPVIFDPAVYFGDRETDLAMTELFGGFSPQFYDAYREAYPVDSGYTVRKTLYNLYHILNHLNLFGSGYLGQSESMIQQLLAELG